MKHIRRCAALFLACTESLEFDGRALLAGAVPLREVLGWQALAPHLPAPIDLDAEQFAALTAFGPTLWVAWERALGRADEAVLRNLIALGLLVEADSDSAAATADARLRDEAWHPLSAALHRQSRWSRNDALAARRRVQPDAIAELVKRLGPPPSECHERPDRRARFSLPTAPQTPLDELLQRRTTCRNYALDASLSQAELGELLDRVFGIRGREELAPGAIALKKNHPSGGAMHSLEAYLLLRRVEGLVPGLYHYACGAGALDLLQELSAEAAEAFILNAVAGQDFFADAPAHVMLAARFPRPQWKYRNHAKMYRVLHIEVGHIAQNLYLSATQQGLGAYITAAINEVEIDQALKLEPMQEGVLAVCGFGRRAGKRTTVEFDPAGKVWPGGTGTG